MRSLVVTVSLAFMITSSPSLSSAAQHAGAGVAAAPTMAAPAIHAAPMHSAPAGIVGSGVVHPAARLSGTHTGAHSRTSYARPATRTSPVAPVAHIPKSAWVTGLPPNSIGPAPSSLAYVNSVPRLLPSSELFGHHHRGDHFRTGGVILPWGDFGGFYYPVPYYEPADNQGDEVTANDSGSAGASENSNEQLAERSAAPAAAPYYPPSEPIYDFVFVKRDGTKIFAVGYSLSKDNLQYVTKEGLRRTIPLNALDFDATQKSNEERGNTVNLPPPPPSAIAAL